MGGVSPPVFNCYSVVGGQGHRGATGRKRIAETVTGRPCDSRAELASSCISCEQLAPANVKWSLTGTVVPLSTESGLLPCGVDARAETPPGATRISLSG